MGLEKFVSDVDSSGEDSAVDARGSDLTGNEVFRSLLSWQKTCTALGIVKKDDKKLPSVSTIDFDENMEVRFFLSFCFIWTFQRC